jgi:uncharacterized protein (TIGR03435 family)
LGIGPVGSSLTGLSGINISMPLLCSRLRRYLKRPVLDRTDLNGSFDFDAAYASDNSDADHVSLVLSSIQAIGLKMESAKGPVETIVIDSAKRPSAN